MMRDETKTMASTRITVAHSLNERVRSGKLLLVLLLHGFFPHRRRPRLKGHPNYGAD